MRELERQTEQPDLWQDRERAESVLTRLSLKLEWQKLARAPTWPSCTSWR